MAATKKQVEAKAGVSPVTVYMPNTIVEQIDRAAARERRQRSPQILVLVEEALEARKLEPASAK